VQGWSREQNIGNVRQGQSPSLLDGVEQGLILYNTKSNVDTQFASAA